MTELKLFNTLTRKKEEFKPISKKEVGMYSCGPTVYSQAHIGNLRSYVFADILKRVLKFNGYKVKHVINVTDVGHLVSDSDEGEDKMEKAAKKTGQTAQELADFYFDRFKEDFEKLRILKPWKWTKATEHIKEQIKLVEKLEKKGFTYKTADGVYFDSSKFKDYGKMARLNLKGLQEGKRVARGGKKNPSDFALWKFSERPGDRQQEWDSPWGLGFPGWHAECSAMSMKYLGERFDIHTGGEDLIPVHHTNEIAQSEAVSGKKFVNYWVHGAFLLDGEGKKVSKSKGGLYTVSELEELGYRPEHFRYLCLLTSYRKPLSFSLDNLDSAKNAFEKLRRKVLFLKEEKHKGKDLTKDYSQRFLDMVNDDLNISGALGVVWEMLDDFDFKAEGKLKLLDKFDEVLGLGVKEFKEEEVSVPKEVLELVEEREKLRKAKMWKEADLFRGRILEKGFVVEDKKEGVRIVKA
ncbi:MAG: cysteine--tRNA ligase [Nanoarchaeota archaeon]|nr:cysteine--tRNA ligase [Nanoarchaeota archaeon]